MIGLDSSMVDAENKRMSFRSFRDARENKKLQKFPPANAVIHPVRKRLEK